MIKRIVKKVFNSVGLDIVRLSKTPKDTLLGLRNLPIKTIIDIGANRGQFARYISTIFPDAHLYCFEPLPEPFNELSQWAEKQNGKVSAFNVALGDREEKLTMYSHTDHSPSSSFLKTTRLCEKYYPQTKKQIPIELNITTLDKWQENHKIPLEPEILIKMDVQGYEDRVIRGGMDLFDKAKACILEVNLDHLYEDQATFNNISLLFQDLDYHYAGNINQTYADDVILLISMQHS